VATIDSRAGGIRLVRWPWVIYIAWVDHFEQRVVEEVGAAGLDAMVAGFYRRVRVDDLIGPMYPDDDWEGSKERLRLFLRFRLLGDTEYTLRRGHPRLRGRHMPFAIGEAERDRWLQLMAAAMDEVGVSGPVREDLDAFFFQVADFMRNR
jgi:hemoglobin